MFWVNVSVNWSMKLFDVLIVSEYFHGDYGDYYYYDNLIDDLVLA